MRRFSPDSTRFSNIFSVVCGESHDIEGSCLWQFIVFLAVNNIMLLLYECNLRLRGAE
jgi:hypothetical protein